VFVPEQFDIEFWRDRREKFQKVLSEDRLFEDPEDEDCDYVALVGMPKEKFLGFAGLDLDEISEIQETIPRRIEEMKFYFLIGKEVMSVFEVIKNELTKARDLSDGNEILSRYRLKYGTKDTFLWESLKIKAQVLLDPEGSPDSKASIRAKLFSLLQDSITDSLKMLDTASGQWEEWASIKALHPKKLQHLEKPIYHADLVARVVHQTLKKKRVSNIARKGAFLMFIMGYSEKLPVQGKRVADDEACIAFNKKLGEAKKYYRRSEVEEDNQEMGDEAQVSTPPSF
jgi:hypothetical protein